MRSGSPIGPIGQFGAGVAIAGHIDKQAAAAARRSIDRRLVKQAEGRLDERRKSIITF